MSPVLRKSPLDSGIPSFSTGEPYPAHFTIKWGGVKVSVKARWGLLSPLRGQGEVSVVVTSGQPRLTLQRRLPTSPSFASTRLTSPLPPLSHWVKNVLCPHFSWNTPPHPPERHSVEDGPVWFPPGWEQTPGSEDRSPPSSCLSGGPRWVKTPHDFKQQNYAQGQDVLSKPGGESSW